MMLLTWLLVSARIVWARPLCYDLFESVSVEKVAAQIRGGCSANAVNKYGETPLYTAVFEGYTDKARLLLENGADPNRVANTGEYPLYLACHNGDLALSWLLLENGADLKKTNGVVCFNGWAHAA